MPPAKWRNPQTAATVLEKTFKSLRLEGKVERYSAINDWVNVVGEEIAAVCLPEKINRGNILVLRVKNPVWAQELSLQKETLLERIRTNAKEAAIEDLRFITGSPLDFKKRQESLNKKATDEFTE